VEVAVALDMTGFEVAGLKLRDALPLKGLVVEVRPVGPCSLQFFGLDSGTLGLLRDRALAERAEAEEKTRSARPGPAAGPRIVVPRQLPAGPAIFTGRTAELAQLDRLLRDREASVPVVISAVSGMGGIGKTALAVHWAHQARDNFRDGELYIDMQGRAASSLERTFPGSRITFPGLGRLFPS
jgi:hypothetical protein